MATGESPNICTAVGWQYGSRWVGAVSVAHFRALSSRSIGRSVTLTRPTLRGSAVQTVNGDESLDGRIDRPQFVFPNRLSGLVQRREGLGTLCESVSLGVLSLRPDVHFHTTRSILQRN
jgi:hypothetical protein